MADSIYARTNVLILLIEALHERCPNDAEVVLHMNDKMFFCAIRTKLGDLTHGSHGMTMSDAVALCAESWLKTTQSNSKWSQLNNAVHGGKL